jgi:hypothetical protein
MVTPMDGATVKTTIPKLVVSTTTGAKYYRYQISQDESFTTSLVDVTKTTYSYTLVSSQALPIGTMYWCVQAIDAAGNASSWSGARAFKVDLLKTPVDGYRTTTTKPVFYWAVAAGATQYEIQIDTSSAFTSPGLIDAYRTTTSYTPATPLAYGTYYWRVRPYTAGGWGNWTSVRSFTIYH